MVKVTSERPALLRINQTESLSKLSEVAMKEAFQTFRVWVTAGMSNPMAAYSSSIIFTDFLYGAGLISDRAYNAIFQLETIMTYISGADSILGTLFGTNGGFASTLTTWVDQKNDSDSNGGNINPEDAALNAANLSAMVPAITAAIGV